MTRRLSRYVSGLLAVLCVLVVLSGVFPVGPALIRVLLVADAPRRADAIVILGGGVFDAQTLTAGTTTRLVHGLRLHHRGYAPVVILTGGNPVNPSVPEAGVMALVARELGVRPEVLVVETVAARTAAQGEAVARIARERGIRSVLLVTSPEHSYRSMRVFEKAGLEVVSAPAVALTLPRLSIVLGPRYVFDRVCGLGPIAYEAAAIALYWWRGWL